MGDYSSIYGGLCAGTHCIYEDRYLRLAMRLMQQARERDCYTIILHERIVVSGSSVRR